MNFRRKRRLAKVMAGVLFATAIIGSLTVGGFLFSDDEKACGVERWAVKTGTDDDVWWIDLTTTWPTSIDEMRNWPKSTSLPNLTLIDPYEFYVFMLDCTLWKFKKKTDVDYHLVLRDENGQTIVAEIPHPGCVNDASLFRDFIVNARDPFDAVYTPTSSFQTVNVPVTITGVAFFDFLHGHTGVAPKGIELHPVLDIQFTGRR